MFITFYSCQKNGAPDSSPSTATREKLCLAGDIIISALSALLALGILLASLNVPIGPLNVLAKATVYSSIPLVAIPLLVVCVNFILLIRKSRSRPKETQIPPPSVDEKANQRVAENDLPTEGNHHNLNEDSPIGALPTSAEEGAEKEIEPKKMFTDLKGTYKRFKEIEQRMSFAKAKDSLQRKAPNNTTLINLVQNLQRISYEPDVDCLIESMEIAQPDDAAVRYQAARYTEKYSQHEVVIEFVKDQHELEAKIRDLTKNVKKPTYVGLISGFYHHLIGNSTHVAPLIFYFPGDGNIDRVECLIADTLGAGSGSWAFSFQEALINWGVQPQSIFISEIVRQADSYSCRTDALVFLRNALLSINYNGYKQGILETLSDGRVQGNAILSLPAEWTYTSQMNADVNSHHKAIRTYCSHLPKTQSALEHRAKHTQEVTRKVGIYKINLQGLIPEIEKDTEFKELFKITQIYIDSWNLTFSERKKINTYLVYKAKKWAEAGHISLHT